MSPGQGSVTIRIDGETITVSDDAGATYRSRNSAAAHELRQLVDPQSLRPLDETPPNLTAGAQAMLSEAAYVEPRTSHTSGATRRGTHAAELQPAVVSAQPPPSTPFLHILEQRRSSRRLRGGDGQHALAVLHQCLRTAAVAVADDGYLLRHRATPSAGGRHPIDTVLLARDLTPIEPGTYLLDGDRGRTLAIEHTRASRAELDAINERCTAAGQLPTQAPGLLLLIADFAATTGRYQAGASLVWRDAGALAFVMHTALFDAGHPSTILGVGGPIGPLAEVLGWPANPTDVGLVGAIAFGTPPV